MQLDRTLPHTLRGILLTASGFAEIMEDDGEAIGQEGVNDVDDLDEATNVDDIDDLGVMDIVDAVDDLGVIDDSDDVKDDPDELMMTGMIAMMIAMTMMRTLIPILHTIVAATKHSKT